jgi:hypothetical protein
LRAALAFYNTLYEKQKDIGPLLIIPTANYNMAQNYVFSCISQEHLIDNWGHPMWRVRMGFLSIKLLGERR